MLKTGFGKKTILMALCLAFTASVAIIGGGQTAYAATYPVTNTNDSGAGSLRQALANADASPGMDTVSFNIPGAGPHIISPASTLPLGSGNSNPVTVDGCSQPGSNCTQFPATINIQIDGSNIPAAVPSVTTGGVFLMRSQGLVVKGLSITGGAVNSHPAFAMVRYADASGSHGNFYQGGLTLESSFIGLAPNGAASGNTALLGNATNTNYQDYRIGGPTQAQGNVISGNTLNGVIFPVQPFGNAPIGHNITIENNYIGLNPAGTVAVPNGGVGVTFGSVDSGVIRNNKIANSASHGISIQKSSGITVANNEITNNGNMGINIVTAFATNPTVITGNTITGSTNDGIAVGTNTSDASRRVTIRQNSIYNNGGLAVDLANNGVTANDVLDPDLGPNTQTNFPVFSALSNSSLAFMNGTYNGLPNQTFTLDFYTNSAADPSGNGEGQSWQGETQVTTDASGNATFGPIPNTDAASDVTMTEATLNGGVLDWVAVAEQAGESMTATATDASGNTSEFSGAVTPTGSLDFADFDVYFEYRAAGSSDPFVATPASEMDFPLSYSQPMTGFGPGESYEYRLVVEGPQGKVLGNLQTFTTLADDDNDGIPNIVEDAAPNSGDANGDGTLDSTQKNVGSFVNTVTNKYAVLELDAACQIDSASVNAESNNSVLDQNFEYPVGLMSFTADCGTPGFVTPVKQYYYGAQDNYVLRKFNPNDKNYFTINGAAVAKATIDGELATTASFSVADGESLDMDSTANGTIVDPAGLAVNTATSQAGGGLAATGQAQSIYVSLSGLLFIAGLVALLKKQRA